jgi:hypothetical protein
MKILSKLYADIFYDNTTSGLTADTIKKALDELNLRKADINVLSSNLILYPTTVDSDIAGYKKMVSSPTDEDYDTTAVNIPTGAITAQDQLLATVISEPGLIVGNPGVFNVNTVGRIRNTDGNANRLASFYYKIFRRSGDENETLIATSEPTSAVSSTSYAEFNASALLQGIEFFTTDRIVIRYYANYITNPGGTFEFEFGGNTPVRSLFPVPISVIPIGQASAVLIDTDGFTGILGEEDSNLQAALNTIDQINSLDIPYDNSDSGLNASTVKEAIDRLFEILQPIAFAQGYEGGEPSTQEQEFLAILDGGSPDSEPTQTIDGGDPSDNGV